jgi:hypothetical protein
LQGNISDFVDEELRIHVSHGFVFLVINVSMVLFGFSREEEDDFLAFSVGKKVFLAPLSHLLKLVGKGKA